MYQVVHRIENLSCHVLMGKVPYGSVVPPSGVPTVTKTYTERGTRYFTRLHPALILARCIPS
ncbi:hypothetical protein PISMIDRAFT_195487 [Pisolithus microcarpus 441]|uniref:Uncharacterized protein n=1 Tax=Pisolithus microcarpus 441 TaxID=765257 RepID=A0A0C9ZDW4_9AGAM|nr:hypothetical protein PISMIDRAFT_195487 [Pisolithus microcarpus 441]